MNEFTFGRISSLAKDLSQTLTGALLDSGTSFNERVSFLTTDGLAVGMEVLLLSGEITISIRAPLLRSES